MEDRPGGIPESRYLESAQVGATLNRLIEAGEELDPSNHLAEGMWLFRWYRANYNSQYGNFTAAKADLEILAAEYDSPILGQLTSTLLDERGENRWLLPEPDALPAPASKFDHLLVAYVAFRWRDADRTWSEAFAACSDEDTPWTYTDFRSVAGLLSNKYEVSYGDALATERTLDTSSARTDHVIAFYQYKNGGDLAQAKQRWEESLALGGDQHAAHNNLGEWHYRHGHLAQARHHLERAMHLRSETWRTRHLLSRVILAQGDLDAAVETLQAGLTIGTAADSEGLRRSLGDLYLDRARALASDVEARDEALAMLDLGQQQYAAFLGSDEQPWSVRSCAAVLDYGYGILTGELAIQELRACVFGALEAGGEGSMQSLYYNLAYIYQVEGRRQEAAPFYLLSAMRGESDSTTVSHAIALAR